MLHARRPKLLSVLVLVSCAVGCAHRSEEPRAVAQGAALSQSDADGSVSGTRAPDGGGPAVCVPVSSIDTTCDRRDDNCNGQIDEDCEFGPADCPSGTTVIEGTAGDDWLVGTAGDDCIIGYGGNDELWGMEGNDVLVGGPGDDKILGFAGDDLILGGPGADTLVGGAGRDRIEGGLGDDSIEGGADRDVIHGGACNDQISDDSDADELYGDQGSDRIVSTAGSLVEGGGGIDACDGSSCEVPALAGRCRTDADCSGGQKCLGGSRLCVAAEIATDANCDGNDDDCDGRTDEGYTSACASGGITSCVNGTIQVTSCDDGNACTADDCTQGEGCTHTAVSCDDGNPCTADSCDPALGCASIPNPGASCSDDNVCTLGETCNASGLCADGVAVNPDDGNPCTDDLCDPVTGVQHVVALGRPCDDGNLCNGIETCDASAGCSLGTPIPTSDGIACTIDVCDPQTGLVAHAPDDAACDDDNRCTSDRCNATAGCQHADTTAACDDGLFCNGVESCNPATGCAAGTPPAVSDGVACTIDSCDEANHTIAHQPSDAACNDHDPCNGTETCDPSLGCMHGTPVPVADADDCTIDSCDPATGQPLHTPNLCNDNNPCTDDRCVHLTGCVHTNNTRRCMDGSACTLNDACAGGACFGGTSTDCNDFNECTAESCDLQANHCGYSRVADGTPCNSGTGSCQQGSCVTGCSPSANAPTLAAVSDQHALVGVAFSFFVVGSDQDAGASLTYALVGAPLPAGLTLDANTGEIHGTPTPATLNGTGDTHGHVVRVSDGCLSAYSNVFSFQVSGVPLPQPFALFDFDNASLVGNALNSVYGGFAGTISGNVQTAQSGPVGQRFRFGGTNGTISVGNASSALKTGGSMTVAMALDQRAAVGQALYACGVAYKEGGGTAFAFGYSVGADGRLSTLHEDSADNNYSTISNQAIGTGPNRIAVVRDVTARTYRYYVEGVADSAGAIGYGANPGNNFGDCTVRIGSDDNVDLFANTFMDELAVWHRVLDANQIATIAWLYRKGIPIQAWISGQTSCQGLFAADPGAIDGTYMITDGSQSQLVSCSHQ
jgi:hypothetical protein